MPNRIKSETFRDISSLNNKFATSTSHYAFDKTIDFFQQKEFSALHTPDDVNSSHSGGVLAKNGNVYALPSTDPHILKIDTKTDTVTRILTNAGTHKWDGCVVGLNGKIYGIPFSEGADVIEFDPNTETTKMLPLTDHYIQPSSGYLQWSSGVLGPDGKIYCTPFNGKQVLVIDTNMNTGVIGPPMVTPVDSVLTTSWSASCLGANGNIYFIPSSTSGGASILELRFNDQSFEFSSPINQNSSNTNITGVRQRCVLAQNGKIYCVPFDDDILTIIDTNKSTVSPSDVTQAAFRTAAGLITGDNFNSCTLSPDGYIYCLPYSTNKILKINPIDDSKEVINIPTATGNFKIKGGVIARNGCIYGIPLESNLVLKFSKTFPQVLNDWILFPQFNKL